MEPMGIRMFSGFLQRSYKEGGREDNKLERLIMSPSLPITRDL